MILRTCNICLAPQELHRIKKITITHQKADPSLPEHHIGWECRKCHAWLTLPWAMAHRVVHARAKQDELEARSRIITPEAAREAGAV